MKKLFFAIVFALVAFVGSYNEASATSHVGYPFPIYWHCYCNPSFPLFNCLIIRPTPRYLIIIPGRLRFIRYAIPGTVPKLATDYSEYNDFFLFSNEDDQTTGVGLTDGCLQYKDADSEFDYYELEGQTTFESLEEWEAQGDTNPQQQ